METFLLVLDKNDAENGHSACIQSYAMDAELHHIPAGWGQSREDLLEKVEKTALEYANLLLKAQQLRALDKPSELDFQSVNTALENELGPLSKEESEVIRAKEDLVTLTPKADCQWVERMLRRAVSLYSPLDVRLSARPALCLQDTEI